MTRDRQNELAREAHRCASAAMLLVVMPSGRAHWTDRLAAAVRAGGCPEAARLLAQASGHWQALAASECRVARREALRHSGGDHQTFQDLQQEGYLGLEKAARRFHPDRGVSFAHYAGWWVRDSVRKYLNNDKPVRPPERSQGLLQQADKWSRLLESRGQRATRATVARALGVRAEAFDAMVWARQPVSIEEMPDTLTDGWDLVAALIEREVLQGLARRMDLLEGRDREVVHRVAGGMPMAEVATVLQISETTVRKTWKRVVHEMRAEVVDG